MSLRKGIVVATHPEDHSVDLVMADDGSRLTGVPVMAGAGTSARTGKADLPDVPEKANKWDITKRDGQDIEALVGYMGRQPVVVGFLFPQVNQVLPKAAGVRVSRHRSDVVQTLDADGNLQIAWPNGTYLRVGETPDKASMEMADAGAVDRNTGRGMHLRIGLAGGAGTITITPGGAITIDVQQAVMIKTPVSALVQAPVITLDGDATVTGNLDVQGATTVQAITSRGKDISSTHRHENSGGPAVGGVPV